MHLSSLHAPLQVSELLARPQDPAGGPNSAVEEPSQVCVVPGDRGTTPLPDARPALAPRPENGQQSAPGGGIMQRAPVLRAERASHSAASLHHMSAPCATRF
jgi:hypothetical protein